MQKIKQEKIEKAEQMFNKLDIIYYKHSEWHWLVEDEWDFWPTTSKFKHKHNGETGKGLRNLINKIGLQ